MLSVVGEEGKDYFRINGGHRRRPSEIPDLLNLVVFQMN
jgi:hypothetical protein